MKIIIDNKIPFIRGEAEKLGFAVEYLVGSEIGRSDVSDADILIVRTRTRCDARLLAGSPVKLVVTATIGYDHLDTSWLESHGILWTNCPGCNASSVRQYVHNSLLAIGKLKAGLTVGVVGVGHVGTLVADDLEQMGMQVMRCDPPKGEPYTIEEIAREADIITFHTPLTHDGDCPTFHLADKVFFNNLRKHPIVINSSRGEVVDNVALVSALDSGQVSQAIIDTWEGEPKINIELLKRAVIATPHIAGYSADGKANATRMSLEAVCQFAGINADIAIEPPTLPDGYSYGEVSSGSLRLYDPRVDSIRLKSSPESFESLRGSYPLRREQ